MSRLPDAQGHFGRYGGRFVPETLMAPLIELEKAYAAARRDRKFQRRLARACWPTTPGGPRRSTSPRA